MSAIENHQLNRLIKAIQENTEAINLFREEFEKFVIHFAEFKHQQQPEHKIL